jgi:glycosyltransferase involved in cell wall biosynthesis
MDNSKYKLLINLGPLKKGGGQNVALNFLQALERQGKLEFRPFFAVCESSLIYEMLIKSRWKNNIIIVSRNPVIRILQELTIVKAYLKCNEIGLVYTYFGFGLFGRRVIQIIGSADSNLYFPEVDFWQHERPLEKAKRFLVDKYRVYGLKIASGVIYENKAMYDRADNLFGVKAKRLILPSIEESPEMRPLGVAFDHESIKILLLCGWQRNKNILLIPELAHSIRTKGKKVQFIITVEADNSSCAIEFFELIKKWQVTDLISCIGPVSKSQLPELYGSVDQVMLLSLLESFSNNIIEAWYYDRPLIISDELWAKAICSNGASYVPRNEVDVIAERVIQLATNPKTLEYLKLNGNKEFLKYPDIDERLKQELEFIESFVR